MGRMDKKNVIKKYVPSIGLRLIKTGIAVFLCFCVNMLRGDADVVFYSHIAAIYCMQDSITETKKNAVNRAVATTVGALYGLVTLLLFPSLAVETMSERLMHGIVISAMVILVVYTTVVIKQRDTAYFANVVYLSIVINNITNSPYLFALNRFLDTMIGIVIALLVNTFRLPRERNRNILFVAELDSALLDREKKLPGYCRVKLNHMIDEGAKFTVSTTHTPGGLMELLQDVKLNYPVIVMDGAALYDIREKMYVRSYVMSYSKAKKVMELLRMEGIDWITHVIIDDMLVSYYRKTENAIYNQLVKEERISPHHNYVLRELPEGEDVVCIRIIDRTERIEAFCRKMEKGELQRLKVSKYAAENHPGYTFLDIYNHNAVPENMISYLSRMLETDEAVTFGNADRKYTYTIDPDDNKRMVRLMRKRFEPLKGFGKKQKDT